MNAERSPPIAFRYGCTLARRLRLAGADKPRIAEQVRALSVSWRVRDMGAFVAAVRSADLDLEKAERAVTGALYSLGREVAFTHGLAPCRGAESEFLNAVADLRVAACGCGLRREGIGELVAAILTPPRPRSPIGDALAAHTKPATPSQPRDLRGVNHVVTRRAA